MGRYDRIQVYHEGRWKTPTEIMVRNGNTWVSLGTHTGDNQTKSGGGVRHLYRPWNTRITKEKKTTQEVIDQYNYGASTIVDNDTWEGNQHWYNYQWVPQYENTQHVFSGTFMKTSATNQNLFYTQDTGTVNNGLWITWLADGRIQVISKYAGNTSTTTYDTVLNTNTWYTIMLKAEAGTTNTELWINGSHYETKSVPQQFEGVNKTHKLGDTYIRMKGNLRIRTIAFSSWSNKRVHDITLNMNTSQAGYGFGYTVDTRDNVSWI